MKEKLKLIWLSLSDILEIIIISGIILYIFGAIFGGIFGQILYSIYNNDTTNTDNKQVVDYDTYIKNTYNQTLTPNKETVEEQEDKSTHEITIEDLQQYKQNYDYIPGQANPFGN